MDDEVELVAIRADMHCDSEGRLCLHVHDREAGIEVLLQVDIAGLSDSTQHADASRRLHAVLMELPEAFYGILQSHRRGESEGILMMRPYD